MRGKPMPTYTVSVTAPGHLAPTFEQVLDVLGGAAMVGDETYPLVTLSFDVHARNRSQAVEKGWLRPAALVPSGSDLDVEVVSSSAVEGRRPWWRRALSRV